MMLSPPLPRVLTWFGVGLLAAGALAVPVAARLEDAGGSGNPMFALHVPFGVLVVLFGWMMLLQLLERVPEEERGTSRPPVALGAVFTVLAVVMLALDLVFRLDAAASGPFWSLLVETVMAWPLLSLGGPVAMILGAALVAVFGHNHRPRWWREPLLGVVSGAAAVAVAVAATALT